MFCFLYDLFYKAKIQSKELLFPILPKLFRFFCCFPFARGIFALAMKTRILLYCFICCTAAFIASAQEQTGYQSDSGLLVMFWNLENFFSPSSEGEFSSTGSRHWTRKRFQAKGRAVAKTVFWTKDIKGRFPDVIGFAETENRTVLERLLSGTVLRKVGYSIVHYDSQDPRGIDVSLLYRKSSLVLLDSAPLRIAGIRTRDILMAKFRKSDGDSIVFLVNHHPSKYGPDSGWKRAEALKRLREAVDSLMDKGLADVVAMGDFNDTPENPAFRTVASPPGESGPPLVNLAFPLARSGAGTIRYSGKWDMIDMFMVSRSIFERGGGSSMEILEVPFLTVRDNVHGGEKPFRTYSGPKYLGGVSDHRPILLWVR